MFALALALLPMVPLLEPSPQEGWSIFPGDGASSGHAQHVHDPTVVQIGNKAFCFSTSGNGFTVVRESRDFKSWTELGPILPTQPDWLARRYRHQSIWAPDIVVLGKTVRMYYAASMFGTNNSVLGLAECLNFDPERPLEGWVDRGLVFETKPGDDSNAIDAEVVIDEGGRHWMFYGSYWGGIFVMELDPATGKLKDPAHPIRTCVATNKTEPGNPLEGAAVIKREGFYYLFVSYGLAAQGVRSTYRIMAGRSKAATGPFLDRDGKSMADGGFVNVLKTSPPMMSPGHCDLLRLQDGRYVMPYHFYDARRAWGNDNWGLPTLQIRELLWSTDGWPLPGLPIEAAMPPKSNSPVGRWLHQADFGQPSEVTFERDGRIIGGPRPGHWRQNGPQLELTWDREGGGAPFVDRVQLAYDGGYYVGRTGTGAVVRAIRPRTGGG